LLIGYVLKAGEGADDIVLLASGSEVHLAVEAHKALSEQGISARVVSVPCMDLFLDQEVLVPLALARLCSSISASQQTPWSPKPKICWVSKVKELPGDVFVTGQLLAAQAFCASGMRSAALWAFAHVEKLGVDGVMDAISTAGYNLEQIRGPLEAKLKT